jgi:hypothetical protein
MLYFCWDRSKVFRKYRFLRLMKIVDALDLSNPCKFRIYFHHCVLLHIRPDSQADVRTSLEMMFPECLPNRSPSRHKILPSSEILPHISKSRVPDFFIYATVNFKESSQTIGIYPDVSRCFSFHSSSRKLNLKFTVNNSIQQSPS